MSIPTFGLTGPELQFANNLNQYLDRQRSVAMLVVNTVADLPPASANHGRSVVVRNIGGSVKGIATALDGVWINYAGVTL